MTPWKKRKKRNWWAEIKEAWEERRGYVKVAIIFGFAGFTYGVLKGMSLEAQNSGAALTRLIDRVPFNPNEIEELKYKGVMELADEIREHGFAQISCSDLEPLCICIDQK